MFSRGKDESLGSLPIAVRQQLQWFVGTLQSHIVNAVVQPLTNELHHQMSAAEDLDSMSEVHERFVNSLQAQCLLSKNLLPIHQSILAVLETVVKFCEVRDKQIGLRTKQNSKENLTIRSKSWRKTGVKARRKAKRVDDFSSSEDDFDESKADDEYDADTEPLVRSPESFHEQMLKMKEELDRLCSFIVTDLRGIGRAGGEASWDMLADQLDWKRKGF